jgi:hypothetical protein
VDESPSIMLDRAGWDWLLSWEDMSPEEQRELWAKWGERLYRIVGKMALAVEEAQALEVSAWIASLAGPEPGEGGE